MYYNDNWMQLCVCRRRSSSSKRPLRTHRRRFTSPLLPPSPSLLAVPLRYAVQFAFTMTDVVTWVYFLAVVNYGKRPNRYCTQASVQVKLLHVLFNVAAEGDKLCARNVLFLLEDVAFLAVVPRVFNAPRPWRDLTKETLLLPGLVCVWLLWEVEVAGKRLT